MSTYLNIAVYVFLNQKRKERKKYEHYNKTLETCNS